MDACIHDMRFDACTRRSPHAWCVCVRVLLVLPLLNYGGGTGMFLYYIVSGFPITAQKIANAILH